MKLTIEISDAEAKGLKAYLQEVGEMKGTKAEIIAHIENIVSGVINSPHEATSDYINRHSRPEQNRGAGAIGCSNDDDY